MADDLDAELLALAGDSEEETSPPPKPKDDSLAPSVSSRSPDRDRSPETMGRKGTAKPHRGARKAVRDEEDGEVSDAESHKSLQSAPMSESESESEQFTAEEVRPKFPYEELYYSAQDKQEIMALPEIQREELLSERSQEVERYNEYVTLRRLLADREREANAKKSKRKAESAGLDDTQRKSSRQKTTLGGRKVGETSGAIEAYKRQREQKGKRDELRRRDRAPSGRRASKISDGSDRDAEAESDVELDDRVNRSPSASKDDPPAELRDIERARVGRTNFAQVCFYPGFEDRITGCYTRANVGPNPETGQMEYRLCLIAGFTQGKPYAMEGSNGRPFITNQYAKLAQGKSVRELPFVYCSDSPFTEVEYNRYRKTMAVEDCKMASRGRLASKVADINRLINHRFTAEELSEKLRRQNALDPKRGLIERMDLEKQVKLAEASGDTAEAQKLQEKLDHMINPKLSWGTSLYKPAAAEKPVDVDKVYNINIRNQKLNYENVRKAQLEERKAARKAAEAVARGEATADPFMRVRTVAKTHHDVTNKTQQASKPVTANPSDTPSSVTKSSPARVAAPGSGQTPKKSKGGFMITYRNNDDENIAALDLDLDIDV